MRAHASWQKHCRSRETPLAFIALKCLWRSPLKVDRDVVETIAKLAQLRLDETEVREYIASMSRVLDLVEQMDAVDTDGIEPMAHPLEATQRLRSDEVTERNQREKFQAIAPATEQGLYLVPKVIE